MESDSFASRGGSYVSRACDECRKRFVYVAGEIKLIGSSKMKCDGVRPMCGVCTTKGSTCEYNDEDKRKYANIHMSVLIMQDQRRADG